MTDMSNFPGKTIIHLNGATMHQIVQQYLSVIMGEQIDVTAIAESDKIGERYFAVTFQPHTNID